MSAKTRRYRQHANPFNIRQAPQIQRWSDIFARTAPLEVEIGFGKGLFLCALAASRPAHDFVGLEIRPHLIEQLHAATAAQGVTNVHALLCNANFHLAELFASASVSAFYIQFPDPWFKKKHHKRRVIQASLLSAITNQLVDAGRLYIVTDQAALAGELIELVKAHPRLINLDGSDGRAPAELCFGPVRTLRERWHMERGDSLYRFRFERRPRPPVP